MTSFTDDNTLTSRPSFAPPHQQYLFSSRDNSYTTKSSAHRIITTLQASLLASTHAPQARRQDYTTSIGPLMHHDHSAASQKRQYSIYNDDSGHSPLGHGHWAQPTAVLPTSWSNDAYMSSDSMGFAAIAPVSGLKRQRSHQRTPSASTVASNGPASPYAFSSSNPQIANTDYDPTYQSFSKDPLVTDPAYLSARYIPGAFSTDMKGVAFDTQQLEELPSPGSGRTSMSTIDQSSPATPAEESDTRKTAFRAFNPHVQLARTESAAYQDELYNPEDFRAIKQPAKQAPTLQNAHRTLINQRLENAAMARSQSPSLSRERSPFREGSQLAPATSWSSPRGAMTAAASRAQQIEKEREETEGALRRPQLNREPTKTISPKDALLDYTDTEATPLFQDTVPIGYKQHTGGNTDVLSNNYLVQQNPTLTLPPTSSQNSMAGFRASSADFTNANFNFVAPAIPTTAANATSMPTQLQLNNYLAAAYPSVDTTPDFPAHLTSMESSISEGPPMSSQDSTIQRPADTRANTGTYTCTYHNCTQRFDSQPALQRHKRDVHRSQQQQRDNLSVETSSASPRSTASPGPTTAGLTSAQILARNSQAGPHKCTRNNPSTGKPCNTIFSRPYDLTRHEDTIHNGRKQKVRCPYCREEKTFSRNDALTRHLRVVHPDVENFGKRSRRNE